MKILLSGLTALAVYLAWGPLPVLRAADHIPKVKLKVAFLRLRLRKRTKQSPMPFLWALHSELLAGALLDTALLRACSTLLPEDLSNTRNALDNQEDVAAALEADAHNPDLVALTDVALLYRISLTTGAPISQAVMRIINSVRDGQRRERTLAQETASTKATVVVLAALPLLGAAMGFGLGLNPLAWFMQSMLGALCLIIGVALEVLGWLWVRLLMRRAIGTA
jgi:tight adherence protein B